MATGAAGAGAGPFVHPPSASCAAHAASAIESLRCMRGSPGNVLAACADSVPSVLESEHTARVGAAPAGGGPAVAER